MLFGKKKNTVGHDGIDYWIALIGWGLKLISALMVFLVANPIPQKKDETTVDISDNKRDSDA